jgi:hypothetical protein
MEKKKKKEKKNLWESSNNEKERCLEDGVEVATFGLLALCVEIQRLQRDLLPLAPERGQLCDQREQGEREKVYEVIIW